MPNKKLLHLISALLFPAVIGIIVVAVIIYRQEIWDVFSSAEQVEEYVESWGIAAPLIYIGVQTFQVVIFIVPGEVAQIGGGFLFGIWLGLFYSIIGIGIGSAINFGLARLLGVKTILILFGKERISRFDRLMKSRRTKIAFFLFFVIPGIPKDILCYVAGLSSMNFFSFLFISLLGRLPGILGSVIIGDAAASEKWLLAGIISALAIVLFLLGIGNREQIYSFIDRLSHRDKDLSKSEDNLNDGKDL